jgi:hypothetical protein
MIVWTVSIIVACFALQTVEGFIQPIQSINRANRILSLAAEKEVRKLVTMKSEYHFSLS